MALPRLITDGGFRWIRDTLCWSKVWKQVGTYEAPADNRTVLTNLEQRGISSLICLCYANPNHPHPSREETKAYGRYAQFVSRELAGLIDTFEIWHEPMPAPRPPGGRPITGLNSDANGIKGRKTEVQKREERLTIGNLDVGRGKGDGIRRHNAFRFASQAKVCQTQGAGLVGGIAATCQGEVHGGDPVPDCRDVVEGVQEHRKLPPALNAQLDGLDRGRGRDFSVTVRFGRCCALDQDRGHTGPAAAAPQPKR